VLPASWVGEITCRAHGLVFLSGPSLEADDVVGWFCFDEIQLITQFNGNSDSECGSWRLNWSPHAPTYLHHLAKSRLKTLAFLGCFSAIDRVLPKHHMASN
jgi:hypothetical protein